DLRTAVAVLEQRCALRPGELEPVDDQAGRGGWSRRRRGYRSAAERFAKTRRLAVLRERLAVAQRAMAAGRPSITVGGKRLWRTRTHLDAAGMADHQWRQRWGARRLFVTADGESGKAGGNETIRVGDDGRLRIKTPAALVSRLGARVVIDAPIRFSHRGDEWADRVATRQSVRYDLCYDAARGRWYLDASWKTTPPPAAPLEELRCGAVLGVDLNDGHLAACVLDRSGNPVGEPTSIEVITSGLPASRRDGRVRAAITALLDHAGQHNCAAVVVETLDFVDARVAGRETLGRGQRGKRLRRTIAGLPTAKFRLRLIGMAAHRGIAVVGVDPAYTSRWGAQHWRQPLQQQTSDQSTVTVHHGAAAAIGRRGLGLRIRRRPTGPRNGRRTAVGTPSARPNPHRASHHDGTAVPAHPHPDQGCGSTGQHPPPAANTVRAAQDPLLLIRNGLRWLGAGSKFSSEGDSYGD
ncbi:MAG: hypothetical protein QOD10_810, partial [Mycobacterium sp.]|nr:hypothetical protein [Mycobacterium sp.]